jgi:hypothetical protein
MMSDDLDDERLRGFVEEYVRGRDLGKAYIKAFGGKSLGPARRKGEELGQREDVQALIAMEEERYGHWSENPLENTDRMIEVVQRLARDSTSDAVKLRAAGMYIQLVQERKTMEEEEDIGAELAAFIEEMKRERLGAMTQNSTGSVKVVDK